MKYKILLPVVGFAFFLGCATTAPTSAERIETVGQSFADTDKQLSETEKELASFEKSVAKLRTSATKQPRMRTKAGFDEALGRLSRRIDETRMDLQELKLANNRGKSAYTEQLGQAATQIEKNSNEPLSE